MSLLRSGKPRAWIVILVFWIHLSSFPGFILSAIVSLDSIEIFKTHEWLPTELTIYFQCKGEKKAFLPDVKKKNVLYTFKGEESWQPLTEFTDKKCKRCGVYEKDHITSDNVFDEWEFCPSDFTASSGKNIHSKDKEFNATFLCPECAPLGGGSEHAESDSHNGEGRLHLAIVILIIVLVSVVLVLVGVAVYKYWQKRKRQQDQARFLKLFEDGDDIEDGLGIGPLDSVY